MFFYNQIFNPQCQTYYNQHQAQLQSFQQKYYPIQNNNMNTYQYTPYQLYQIGSFYQNPNGQIFQYKIQQENEVLKAVKAMKDLCESFKKLDDEHQQQAILLSLGVMAKEFGWDR